MYKRKYVWKGEKHGGAPQPPQKFAWEKKGGKFAFSCVHTNIDPIVGGLEKQEMGKLMKAVGGRFRVLRWVVGRLEVMDEE